MAKPVKKRNQQQAPVVAETTAPVAVEVAPIEAVTLTLTRKTATFTLGLKQYKGKEVGYTTKEVEGRVIKCSNPDIQLFLYRDDNKDYVVTEVTSSHSIRSGSTMKAAVQETENAINANLGSIMKLIEKGAKEMAKNLSKGEIKEETVEAQPVVDPYDAYLDANIPPETDEALTDIGEVWAEATTVDAPKQEVKVTTDAEPFFDDEEEETMNETVNLMKLTVKELSAMAKEKGLNTSRIQRKADFVKLIETGINHLVAPEVEEAPVAEEVAPELTVAQQVTADIMNAINTVSDKEELAAYIQARIESVQTVEAPVKETDKKNETKASTTTPSSASGASAIIVRQSPSTLVYQHDGINYTVSVGQHGVIQIKDNVTFTIVKHERSAITEQLSTQGLTNIVEALNAFLKPFEKFEWFTGKAQPNQQQKQRAGASGQRSNQQGKQHKGNKEMNVTVYLGAGKKASIPYSFVKEHKAKFPNATGIEMVNAFKSTNGGKK